jgi:dihydrofolate reductase
VTGRKLVLLEHVSLDGYLAGPNGEMDWIRVEDDAMWDDLKALTDAADTAIFGRTTYAMMESYWPTAGDAPGASQHDVDHSRWLNNSTMIVVSRTLESARWGAAGTARIVNDPTALRALKEQPGANMLLIGSASVARECNRLGLIDEYRINVNPVLLGGGTPLFGPLATGRTLRLVGSRTFAGGVVGLHYACLPV